MRDALIVSTARTPIGRAYRGAFNDTQAQELLGHAIQHAVARAGIDPARIEDVVAGAALQQGSTGSNVARQAAIRAGLPVTVAGMSLDRQCASGMMAIATAAKQVIHDGMEVCVGGGVESVSLVQTPNMRRDRLVDPWIRAHKPAIYMSMLETAETVAERYGVARDDQDAYALQSQRRTAEAQEAGLLDAEIVPLASVMKIQNRETGCKGCNRCTRTASRSRSANTSPPGTPASCPTAPRPRS
jgi:acetyl-CoA C-acetyltransferase